MRQSYFDLPKKEAALLDSLILLLTIDH